MKRRPGGRGGLTCVVLLVAVLTGVLGGVSPAGAHLTGVFRYFLKDVEEGTASSRLLEIQIDETNRRLAELRPELEAARRAYRQAVEPAKTKIRFYNRFSGNLFGALLVGSDDLVDTLANLYLIQHVIGQDVAQLQEVAQRYQRLQTQQRNLRLYRDLLQAIQQVHARRQAMLSSVPDTETDRQLLLYRIAEDWETMRETSFVGYFRWASRQLRNLPDLAERTRTGAWRVTEERWNEALAGQDAPVEDGWWYLRADHLYFSGYLPGTLVEKHHVFTVGLLNRVDATTVEYRLDAVYVDGFPVDPNDPDVEQDIYQQNLLVIDGTWLARAAEQMLFNQNNGSVELSVRP